MSTRNLFRRFPTVSLHLALIIGACATFYPILMIVLNSLKTSEEIRKFPASFPQGFHFQNYIDVWERAHFGRLFFNSFVIIILALVLIYIVSALAAYSFARIKFPGKGFLYVLFLSGIMFPVQFAIIPLFKMVTQLHLVNNPLSIILVDATFGLPLAILILTTFVKGLPREIEESARIDGCSTLGILFRIVLPLIKPASTTVMIINAIYIWNDLLLPVIFMTSEKAKTLPAGLMYFTGQYTSQWEYITAAIVIMSLPIIIFYLIMQKDIINGLSAGAVKG